MPKDPLDKIEALVDALSDEDFKVLARLIARRYAAMQPKTDLPPARPRGRPRKNKGGNIEKEQANAA